MQIVSGSHFDETTLIEKLREVTLLEDPSVKIYKDCLITLEFIDPNTITPCQTYVLNSVLQKVRELRFELEDVLQDMFRLRGYSVFTEEVTYQTSDQYYGDGKPWQKRYTHTLLPPIIEESIESNGKIVNLINDGLHRLFLAKMESKMVEVVFIRGVSKMYPYYAYPLENGWNDVQRVDDIPKGFIKKWHRIKENKRLYRNFDSVFEECSKPRGIME